MDTSPIPARFMKMKFFVFVFGIVFCCLQNNSPNTVKREYLAQTYFSAISNENLLAQIYFSASTPHGQ
jgi:hypothetical protein